MIHVHTIIRIQNAHLNAHTDVIYLNWYNQHMRIRAFACTFLFSFITGVPAHSIPAQSPLTRWPCRLPPQMFPGHVTVHWLHPMVQAHSGTLSLSCFLLLYLLQTPLLCGLGIFSAKNIMQFGGAVDKGETDKWIESKNLRVLFPRSHSRILKLKERIQRKCEISDHGKIQGGNKLG